MTRVFMRRSLVVAFAVLVLLVGGCKDKKDNGGQSAPIVGAQSATRSAGCGAAGPQTSALLPSFSEITRLGPVTTVQNPCLGAVQLVDQVIGPLADADRTKAGSKFIGDLKKFTGRLDKLATAQESAYQTDRLAIELYQHQKYPWSIGAVAVLRGGAGAVLDIAVCYLIDQVPFLQGDMVTDDGIEAQPCLSILRVTRDGQTYTVVWAGSSNVMCKRLSDTYTGYISGSGKVVAVHVDTSVAVRSGPSTSDKVIDRVLNGTLGRALCHAVGETVNGSGGSSPIWTETSIDGVTGYISHLYLDNDLDVSNTCPSP